MSGAYGATAVDDIGLGSDGQFLIKDKEIKSSDKEYEVEDTHGNIDSERWLGTAKANKLIEDPEISEVSHKLLGYLILKQTGNKFKKTRCCSCRKNRAY